MDSAPARGACGSSDTGMRSATFFDNGYYENIVRHEDIGWTHLINSGSRCLMHCTASHPDMCNQEWVEMSSILRKL